ncbi:hypothetical protein GNI_124300 [Gregarina niphandrodes]|uniref:Uncharacterized protein n=1 Tax=Gregarina niphandrodes TaxID=110365 RepID=A0A023B255_GRENI|nr:hypothetical protein GNI_124300 [Gregarina niphandrodes]EZG51521.1 hypothetical protein GNI_124300 [Gregarina niphandrodes]|eukprot:XP_011131959.1 hypothetical protein GNI_124300 [Gregarina niphandrodes]
MRALEPVRGFEVFGRVSQSTLLAGLFRVGAGGMLQSHSEFDDATLIRHRVALQLDGTHPTLYLTLDTRGLPAGEDTLCILREAVRGWSSDALFPNQRGLQVRPGDPEAAVQLDERQLHGAHLPGGQLASTEVVRKKLAWIRPLVLLVNANAIAAGAVLTDANRPVRKEAVARFFDHNGEGDYVRLLFDSDENDQEEAAAATQLAATDRIHWDMHDETRLHAWTVVNDEEDDESDGSESDDDDTLILKCRRRG